MSEKISRFFRSLVRNVIVRYSLPVVAIFVTTLVFYPLSDRINSTTVALFFLIIILGFATFLGRNPALLASFVGMLCFNYFFLHPVGTWFIADPQNLIAWASFTITAIVAGELSAYARRRASEAERLYGELQAAFETAADSEAVRRSEKLKSALLDAVSHDLRTPLTSIKAAVTTLMDSEGGHRTIELKSNERVEFLHIINEETDRLNGFIESMVELARAEAGEAYSGSSTADVEEVISNTLGRAGRLIHAHKVSVAISEGLPLARADSRAVAEVLYNVVENAAKYSPPGSKIALEARIDGDNIVISVSDEGTGIPRAMREHVFQKFLRLKDSEGEGMGLGLSISRSIIEANGGNIVIDEPDRDAGTKVLMTLPAVT
jgi:K+-sensing histidine kinase KdpD